MNKLSLFLKRNSSTILTCIGATGVIATAVTAATATPKAMSLLQKAKEEKNDELTTFEKVRVAGPAYIPSIVIGASTIACIFGANALNKRQQAALTSAYALLDSSYKAYRKKVQEMYGEESHMNIAKNIEADKYKETNFKSTSDKHVFFDFFSLQFFESTLDDIQKAEKKINDIFKRRGYVTLAEFYDELGIQCGDVDREIGWSEMAGVREGYDHIEFFVEKLEGEDRYVLTMPIEPTADYLWTY